MCTWGNLMKNKLRSMVLIIARLLPTITFLPSGCADPVIQSVSDEGIIMYVKSEKFATDEMDMRIFVLSCQYGLW